MDPSQLNEESQIAQGDLVPLSTDLRKDPSCLTWGRMTTDQMGNLMTSHPLNNDGNGAVQVTPPTLTFQGQSKVNYNY